MHRNGLGRAALLLVAAALIPACHSDSSRVPIAPSTISFIQAIFQEDENVVGGVALITVERTGSSAGVASVEIFDDGTGTAVEGAVLPADYTYMSPQPLAWASGELGQKTVMVAVLDDAIIEGTLSVDFSLGTLVGAVAGAQNMATLDILDDDGPGVLQFTSATYGIDEGAGTVTLTVLVERVGGIVGAVSVDVIDDLTGTAVPGAVAPADYTFATQTLAWGNGAGGTMSVSITMIQDVTVEAAPLTIDLSLDAASLTGGATIGTPGATTISILDDEVVPTGDLEFDAADVTPVVNEIDGSVTLTVNRVGGSAGTVIVTFDTQDSIPASADSTGKAKEIDYVAQSGVLIFGPGVTSQDIVVVINNNDTGNPTEAASETFEVILSNPTIAITGTNPAVVTINDD